MTWGSAAPSICAAVRVRVLVAVPDAQLGLLTGNRFFASHHCLARHAGEQCPGRAREATASTKSAAVAHQGLRRMYIGTLTFSLFWPCLGRCCWRCCLAITGPASCCSWPKACAMWPGAI